MYVIANYLASNNKREKCNLGGQKIHRISFTSPFLRKAKVVISEIQKRENCFQQFWGVSEMKLEDDF